MFREDDFSSIKVQDCMIRTIHLVSVVGVYQVEIFNLISKLFLYQLMIKLKIFLFSVE